MIRSKISFLVLFWSAVALACFSCSDNAVEFSEREREIIRSLSLHSLPEVPASPSNRFANNKAAAAFGETLFFDQRLSLNGDISCSSCHVPELAFSDGKAVGEGVDVLPRNSLGLVGVAYHPWLYWDGRRDSLWAQALVPIEAGKEMGSSRVAAIRLVGSDKTLLQTYESIFGRFPASLDLNALPAQAGPLGNAAYQDAWYRLDELTKQTVNHVYANLGKAIAAYERTISLPEARFDKFADALLKGQSKAARQLLSEQELHGLSLFLDEAKTQCLQCHNGPLLTSHEFHNVKSGRFEGQDLDYGRYFGVQSVVIDEFNCMGRYSDAKPEECTALRFLNKHGHQTLAGAFKVPSLRELALTAPYFHDGRHANIEAVLRHYVDVSREGERGVDHDLAKIELSEEEIKALSAFVLTFSSRDDSGS